MTAARKHDPEASRAAILAAAEAVFVERGFAGASMSEIAKASGVTKSLIHHHFGSKDALWREVKRTRFRAYYDEQMRLFDTSAPTPELLRESMAAYFHFLRHNPQMMRMMSWMRLEGDQACDDMVEELRSVGVQRIAAAQETGLLRRDLPAEFILVTFLGMVQAWFEEQACPASAQPNATEDAVATAYLDAAWKIFSAGVMAEGS